MHTIAAFFASIVMGIGSLLGMSPAEPVVSATSTSFAETVASGSPVSVFGTALSGVADRISSALSTGTLPAGSAWLTTLPLGDGKYVTSGPKKGYIYLCRVATGGKGAQVNGPWIHGTTWTPSEKVHVEGAVSWPEATYSMTVENGTRKISSNDLPTDHTTGIFPVRASDPAAAYDRNQGIITAHPYSFSFPAYPTAAATPGCIYGEVGIMNNGVLLFDGFDALNRDALAHEVQDDHDGHPNDSGYHKHGFIDDIRDLSVSEVVGYAFDGYPITGPLLPNGNYLTTSDLDECHGMTSDIVLDGTTRSSYHYVLTQDFPYSVSCFHGTSKVTPETLRAQGLDTNGGTEEAAHTHEETGTRPAPPQEAVAACSGKKTGASCQVGANVTGTCQSIDTAFACVPKR